MKRNIFLIMLLFKVLFLNAQSNDSVNTNSNLNKTNLQLSFRYFNKTVLSGRNYMIDGCMYNPAISFNLKSVCLVTPASGENDFKSSEK